MIIRDKEGLIKRADVIFTSRYVRMIVRMNTESSKVVVVVTLVNVIASSSKSTQSLWEFHGTLTMYTAKTVPSAT